MQCQKCKTEMKPGKAILQTSVPTGEKWGERSWMRFGGPGKLIDCQKCHECGFSVTKE